MKRRAVGWHVMGSLLAVVMLGACGPPSTRAPADGGQAAAPTSDAGAPHGEPQFEVLAVSTSSPEMGVIQHATSPEKLRRLWSRFGFPGDPVSVDLEQHLVLVYAQADDACPDEIVGFTLDGEELVAQWQPPPGGCNQPLIPTATAVAVDRATVPTAFVAVIAGFAQEYPKVEHRVELDGRPTAAAPEPGVRPAAPEPTTVLGRIDLPPPGEAAIGRLEDGTPVWVVHHADATASVLAADVVLDGTQRDADSGHVPGLRTQVGWSASERRFLAAGSFDEHGVSLNGRAAPNLDWHAAAVRDDGTVDVGQRLGSVPYETPVAPRSAGGDMQDIRFPDDLGRGVDAMSLDDALSQPEGSVVVVDAALVAYPDRPLQTCSPPDGAALWKWTGCPDDAPVPDGIGPYAGPGNTMNVWFGPLRVTVASGTFTDVITLGGGTAGGVVE